MLPSIEAALAHSLGWAAVAHVESGRPDRARRIVQQIDDYLAAEKGLNAYYGAAMPHIAAIPRLRRLRAQRKRRRCDHAEDAACQRRDDDPGKDRHGLRVGEK